VRIETEIRDPKRPLAQLHETFVLVIPGMRTGPRRPKPSTWRVPSIASAATGWPKPTDAVGFEHGQSVRPLANPRTLKEPGKDGGEGAPLAERPGMPTIAFRAQLQREIAADPRAQQ